MQVLVWRLLRIRLVILLRLAMVLVVITITPIMLALLPFWLELPEFEPTAQ